MYIPVTDIRFCSRTPISRSLYKNTILDAEAIMIGRYRHNRHYRKLVIKNLLESSRARVAHSSLRLEQYTSVRLDVWLRSYGPLRTLRSLLEYYTLLDTSFLLIQT